MSLKNILGAIVLIGILFGGWFLITYNGLVSAQEAVDAQWYKVENQYQRRSDLIPTLVDVVKGSAAHEEKILTEVIKYQSQWNNATTREEKIEAIEAAKGTDFISVPKRLAENYPQLKSNETFLALQSQIEGTQNRIHVEIGRYDEAVRDYNIKIKKIPDSIIANMFGFKSKAYFEAERGAEEAPVVNFGTPAATPDLTTTTPIPSASVELYGEKTDVDLGEDIILKLSAVNLITKPVMTVQVILIPPPGTSVTSSDFATSGAGQYTATYKLNPGSGKDIEVRIKTSQVGDFKVKGRIVYYFGDDKSTAEDHTLELPIKVRASKKPGG